MINKEERELIEKLHKGNKIGIYELIRTFKREGIENFITTRRKYIDIMIDLIQNQENRIKELEATNNEHQKLNGELQQKLTKAENKNSIMEFNCQILQGEMDRIGIDTLKLEPGNSTDDVIDEIKKMQKKLTYYEEICKGKSIQELGMSDLYKED